MSLGFAGVDLNWRNTDLANRKSSSSDVDYDGSIFSKGYSSTTDSSSSSKLSSSKVDAYVDFVNEFINTNGADKLEEALEKVPAEYLNDVKAALIVCSDEEEALIDSYMKAEGVKRYEALVALGLMPEEIDLDTSKRNSIDSTGIGMVVDNLYDARTTGGIFGYRHEKDKSCFEEYLVTNNYSSADIVAIASAFVGKYESLSDVLDYTFANDDTKRKEYQTVYAKALIDQVKAGNEDAIRLVCEEFKSSGQEHGLVEAFMENADPETLRTVYEAYSEFTEGKENMTKRVEKMFKGDQEAKYVKIIEDAFVKIQ